MATYFRKEHAGIELYVKKSPVVVAFFPTHNQDIAHYYPFKHHLINSIFKDSKYPAVPVLPEGRFPPFFLLSFLAPSHSVCPFPHHLSSSVVSHSFTAPHLSPPTGPLFLPISFGLSSTPDRTFSAVPLYPSSLPLEMVPSPASFD